MFFSLLDLLRLLSLRAKQFETNCIICLSEFSREQGFDDNKGSWRGDNNCGEITPKNLSNSNTSKWWS